MVAPLREKLQDYHNTAAQQWMKNIVAVITQGRVIDDTLKSQILQTCRLFQLTKIFQIINNWSKVF